MTISSQYTENNSQLPSGRMNHTVQIERRKHTVITGVTEVCSFHETEIVLKVDSSVMILMGEGLHIAKLLLDDGRLDVEGHVDSLVYEAPKKVFKISLPWKRRKV